MNMERNILSMLNTIKKKAGVVLLCGALVTVIGAGAVFAANSITSVQVKMENGISSYSTDGGKTWSQNVPDGVNDKDGKLTIWSEKALDGAEDNITTDEDGNITHTNGNPSGDAKGTSVQVKMENGVVSYSTDGGKTWSQNVPDGVNDKDGKLTIWSEKALDGAEDSVTI